MGTRELAVLKTFKSIKDNFRISSRDVDIDNLAFKLHYRATAGFLLSCTALVSTYTYFGGHIACVSDKGVSEQVINSFCFFSSTFTVVRHLNSSSVDQGLALGPGVGPLAPGDEVVRHAYYQWVPFLLFAQALCFCLPHLAWKALEGGSVKGFSAGLRGLQLAVGDQELRLGRGVVVPTRQHREAAVSTAARAFLARRPLFGGWALRLAACELMNLANVVLQVAAIHAFLGNRFWDLRPWVGGGNLDAVFPKLTKCSFHKFGPGGSVQTHDALCVMQLNLVNEIIFAATWFWMVFLAAATVGAVAWRAGTFLLHGRSRGLAEALLTASYPGRPRDGSARQVADGCDYPSWLFLRYLGRNVDAATFRDLVRAVAEQLSPGSTHDDDHHPSRQETFPLNNNSLKKHDVVQF
ncbi:innexin inx7-like [Bacillus rossius redtenbacheri]|uniref:innexin inx7-like n=1 Tax=Bacillus rossius redtenbacheri TaxID=93214 RepID=UPI002FDD4109